MHVWEPPTVQHNPSHMKTSARKAGLARRDLKPGPPEYVSGRLITQPYHLVSVTLFLSKG
jgi:hypothetical protein